MSQIAWSENDALFLNELKEGIKWQRLPEMLFNLHGLKTIMGDNNSFRDSIKNSSEYKDSFDVLVEDRFNIESKSRNYKFTSPADFPFDTIFIENVSGYEQRVKPVFAYVNVSKITGGMIFIGGKKTSNWKIVKAFDKTRKIYDEWYCVSKEKFRTMDFLINKIKKDCGL